MTFIHSQNYLINILLIGCLISFTYDSKLNLVKTKKIYVVYTLIMGCFMQIIFWQISVIFVKSFTAIESKYSPVSEMVYVVEVWAIEIAYILIQWSARFNRYKQVKFLNRILEIEKEILKFHQVTCYRRWKSTSLRYLLASFFFYVFACFLKFAFIFRGQIERQLVLLFFSIGVLFLNAVVILLLMIVKMQKRMFEILYENLTNMLKNVSSFNFKQLSDICELHNQLYKTLKMFNNSFGIYYIAIFFYNVGMQTCQLYIGPFSLTLQTNALFLFKINSILNGLWTTPSLILCTLLGYECNKTKQEAQRIRLLLQYEAGFNKSKLNELVHNKNIL